MTDLGYKDLAPNDTIENGEEYLQSLDWALQDSKIKNIALAGPYGAGKSSVIDTFLKRKDSRPFSTRIYDKFHGRRIPSSKNSLKISMATFSSSLNDSDDSSKVKLDINEIETGILKQLFYKVKYYRIPQSRYRKLHTVDSYKIFFSEIILLLIIILFVFVFNFSYFSSLYENVIQAGNRIHLSSIPTLILFSTLCLVTLWIFALIYRFILSKFSLKQIKITASASVEASESSNESVFNKNLDEIIYFFEETKYQYVFFEDLDRLDNPELFIHLRELNTLLNNDDAIKNPIVFIYAVKDDIFLGNDRTKFFDFIIPIVPIINSTNSSELLLKRISSESGNPVFQNISQETILDISPFISDMRTLQNICNEFIVYKNTLGYEISLSDDRMFAIMAFKNLYPKDFSELQNESGIVKKAFEDKQQFTHVHAESIQKCIDHDEDILNRMDSDSLRGCHEIKSAMLLAIVGSNNIVARISSYNPSRDVSYNTIMSDSFDLLSLKEIKRCTVYYCPLFSNSYYNEYNKNIDNLQVLISDYLNRWEAFREGETRKPEDIKDNIASCRKQQRNLSKESLKDLLHQYPAEDIFSSTVRENKLLVFLLRRGYINEEYANYINYFKGTSITKDDMNFILSVKTQSALPFDYSLSKTEMVIRRLQPYEFEQKEILNYALLEQLFSLPSETKKLNAFISQLANESSTSWDFIDSFIDITKHSSMFIQQLTSSWKGIWSSISQNPSLSYDRQIMYLSLLITHIPASALPSLNQNNSLVAFIESHEDILQTLSEVPVEKCIACIKSLNIKFSNISIDNVSPSITSYIFDNNCYVINPLMIHLAISHYSPFCSEFNICQKPFTTILTLKNHPIKAYIQNNLSVFVENILSTSPVSDDVIAITTMLELSIDNLNLCEKIITCESFCMPSFCFESMIDSKQAQVLNIWDSLLSHQKIAASFSNVTLYWNHFNLTDTLLSFIVAKKESLCASNISDLTVDDKLICDIVNSDIDNTSFSYFVHHLRAKNYTPPISNLSESKLSILIECHYFPFTPDYYAKIHNKSSTISLKYLAKNQEAFIESIESIAIDSALFEDLILSEEITLTTKSKLISLFSKSLMSSSIAVYLVTSSFPFTISTFNLVWPLLDPAVQQQFFLKHLNILDIDDFYRIFKQLSSFYPNLCDRTSRHTVKLPASSENRRLASRLKEVGYISSFDDFEKDSSIRLRIRPIKQ